MSILVSNIRLPFDEPEGEAIEQAKQICHVQSKTVTASVYRTSIDARRGKIDRVYSVLLDGIVEEEAFAATLQMPSVCYKRVGEFTPILGHKTLVHRPVVVGMGPAGLFAGYLLAKYGYQPMVLERGDAMEQRDAAVRAFWEQGQFDGESNIQFGEGGAGAYSDGKLTTRINDPLCDEILRIFTAHGAPEEIRRLAKPHIGTDILKDVVRKMREQIIEWGGRCTSALRLQGYKRSRADSAQSRWTDSLSAVSVRFLPWDTVHAIPFLPCMSKGCSSNPNHFQSAQELSICKQKSTNPVMAGMPDITHFPLRNTICPIGTMDVPAIRFACVREDMWLQHRARRIPL